MAEPKSVCPAVDAAMKQKQLAKKLDQSEKAIVDLVTGNSPILGPTLQNVAEALGMGDPIPLDGTHGA